MAAALTPRAAGFRGSRPSAESLSIWIAGVGLALLLGLLAWTARSWAAPVAAVAVLAVGAYYVRALGPAVGLVLLLLVAATADRFTFPVGGFSIRAEQVAAIAGLAVLAMSIFRERNWKLLKPDLAEAFLIAWLASNVVSSLLASPDRRLSAKILALFAICSVGLFLPRRLIRGTGAKERLETVTKWLLVLFATEGAYATATYLVHVLGPSLALGVNTATGYLSDYGTLWEQNVLGAFTAAGLVAWAYLGPRRLRWTWLGMAFSAGALIASLTRAAWLAAAALAGLALLLPGLRRRLDRREVVKGTIASAAVIAAILLLSRSGRYGSPVPGSNVSASGGLLAAILNRVDIIGRLNQVPLVLDDIRNNVLLGRGTAAFEALHQVKGSPEHLASLPLNILDGSGVIGLLIFTAFILAVIARAWRARSSEIALALGQVAIVILIGNLATENLELMIGWLLVGLLLAATDVAGLPDRLPTVERAPAAIPY